MAHLRANHLDEPRVSDAMAMEKGKRRNAVQQIRLEAMKKTNEIRLVEGKEPIRIRNRASSTTTYTSYCDTCHGFFSSSSRARHKCKASTVKKVKPNVPLKADRFQEDVVIHFRDDSIGKLASNDYACLTLGRHLFREDGSHRRKVMAPMRLLAKIIEKFGELSGDRGSSGEDMLHTHNWPVIEEAIISVHGSQESIDLSTSAILKKTVLSLQAEYAIQDTTQSRVKEERMQRLLNIIEMKGVSLFGPSQSALKQARTKNRMPQENPCEADIDRLQRVTHTNIVRILQQKEDDVSYKELRENLVTR